MEEIREQWLELGIIRSALDNFQPLKFCPVYDEKKFAVGDEVSASDVHCEPEFLDYDAIDIDTKPQEIFKHAIDIYFLTSH